MSTATLSSPLELAPGLILRNRTVVASLVRDRAGGEKDLNTGTQSDACPNEYLVEYYRQRARGGFGLIMTEGTLVEPQGTEWPNTAGIWSQEQIAAWKKVTDAVHEEGGAIFCQLWHAGRVSHPDQKMQKVFGQPVKAVSNISARGGKFRQLDGLPGYVAAPAIEEPKVIVELYRQAAVNAKEAGFDGVELHCSNGYLPNQFLDKYSNLRTDSYGGSAEGRVKFAVEVLEAMTSVYSPDRVGVKINPTGGYNDVGMDEADTEETYTLLLHAVSRLSLGHVQFVRHAPYDDRVFVGPGVNDGKKRSLCPTFDLEGKLAQPFIAGQKKDGRQRLTKLFWNGGFGGKEVGGEAEGTEWIERGSADAIVYGVDSITTPDLPYRYFNKLSVPQPGEGHMKTWYSGTAEKGKYDGYITNGFSAEFLSTHGEGNVAARVH